MERFYSYSDQRDDDSNSNPSTSQVDFNDVFGGPPRRSSGFSGEEGEPGWCRWPVESEREKPVFGDDSGVRRRYTNNKKAKDFFDDIFGGEESQSQSPSGCSTPKKRDGDGFSPALQPLASSLPPSFRFSFFSALFLCICVNIVFLVIVIHSFFPLLFNMLVI